jgi:hypothetical protein
MRIVAASVLAVVAVGATAGTVSAQNAWDGYLAGAFGSTQFIKDPPIDPQSDWIGQGRATFEAHSANNLGFQADAVFTHQNLSGISGYDDAKFATTDAALHGFYRVPGKYLVGVIGQWQQNEYSLTPQHWTMTQYWVGAEAQGFLNDALSIYGKAAFKSVTNADYDFNATGWTATARARYFFSPNFLVEANVEFDSMNESGAGAGNSYQATSFGAGLEYQLASLPVSTFIRYEHETLSNNLSSTRYYNDRILFGAKWNFGGKSLWDRETNGAALDPFGPQPFGYNPYVM